MMSSHCFEIFKRTEACKILTPVYFGLATSHALCVKYLVGFG